MEPLILKDKNVFPTNEVIADVLEASFPAFEEFSASAAAADLTLEWNYYNDGKAWLCKVLSKKKNLAWLVVYQNYFRTTSYFTEKHLNRIADMEITESIKEEFYRAIASPALVFTTDNLFLSVSITSRRASLPEGAGADVRCCSSVSLVQDATERSRVNRLIPYNLLNSLIFIFIC